MTDAATTRAEGAPGPLDADDLAAAPLTDLEAARLLDAVLTARQRLERIKAACADAVRAAEADVSEAEQALPALEAWARANPPVKGKTIRLPVGQLGWRRVPGGPRVVDDQAALSWARAALPHAVRVTEAIDKAAIKAHVQATGELPPGCELVADEERFSVKG